MVAGWQLKQMEDELQLKLIKQDKVWKRKFDDVARQHKNVLNQVVWALSILTVLYDSLSRLDF